MMDKSQNVWPPCLFFSRKFSNKKNRFNTLKSVAPENVVMHVCTETNNKRSFKRIAFGATGIPKNKIQNSDTMSGQKLGKYSSSDLDSAFKHLRFNAGYKWGKILVFHNKRNIIRAGKHTHADALLSVLRFISWSNCNNSGWFTGIATPNSVFSGEFKEPPAKSLRSCPHISFSDKFPGMSVNVSHALSAITKNPIKQNCCTPEIYNSGKFIIPGVKTPDDLITACTVLNHLGKKYKQ